ncbi:type II secretory system protein [Candidatus Scalindua japonica]|uniref:Type II secretory system protein n=1 Tax=Candidatus Scalindua japonica TaxID=1284222 RepID=A0A286TYW1_9BACT|nr:ATPase, T2SS/T4P/T4SS family [Candidatus Scalindua japonica]GAX61075.1 type II secretory system protein [Candidatus Scalindua japonica]
MIQNEAKKESRVKLADILVSEGVITEEDLKKCLDEQKKSEVPFEQAALTTGLATRESIANALGNYYDVPYVDLDNYDIDTNILKVVSERLARKYKFLPLFKITNNLTIAISDPRNLYGIDEIRDILDCDIGVTVSSESQILQSLDKYYGSTVEDLTDVVDDIVQNEFEGFDEDVEVEKIKEVDLETVSEEALERSPIVKLLNTILHRAIREGVSDIHIQHEEDSMLIRYRLDGILYHASTLPKKLRNTLVSRIKVIAGMNIAESRLPQDGRFKVKISGREFDFRVSTMPTVFGECVVMRILDKRTASMRLEQLGFTTESLERYQSFIDRPNGIVLITGPTGSGKTTTLYASLNRINSPEKNIITVEDPVEYHLNLIRQTQINTKAGVTFAYAMRSILRQDPDVIMIGEMRDRETAEIAIQAAMTGHLVFSTLHTNDAPGAISRLIDMGVEPFLIASSVIGIVAQRLVRANCKYCTETYVPDEKLLTGARLHDKTDITFSKGKGCERCRKSGYKGRLGLYETLAVDNQIRDLIIRQETPHVIAKSARETQGFKSLVDDGIDKVENGLTSLEEVFTVASSV